MTGRATSSTANQSRPNSARYTLTESLEQLAAASRNLADLAAKVLNLDNDNVAKVDGTDEPANVEQARLVLASVFDTGNIQGYDGSESMEKAREAYFQAALDMYKVMAVDSADVTDSVVDDGLALRIGEALLRELKDYYRATLPGNDRVTFTTEQRTALESAFLLKPKLNIAEKRALAKTCNLNPRQVEVWVRALIVTAANVLFSFRIGGPVKSERKDGWNSVVCRINDTDPSTNSE